MDIQPSATPKIGAKRSRPPLPPGARGLPLVGVIPEVSRWGMPEVLRQSWQRYGEVSRIALPGRTVILLAHPDHVKHVLFDNRANYYKGTTYDAFRLLAGNGMITAEGEDWKRQRRLAAPAFHNESVEALAQVMTTATTDMLAEWDAQGGAARFDLHAEMTRLTLRIVGETLFGQNLSTDSALSSPAFSTALHAITERGNASFALPMWLPTPANVRLRRSLHTLDQLVYQVIERSRRGGAPRHSLLAMLMNAVDDQSAQGNDRMDDSQLRDEVITMYLAGHETTALALTWTWHLLSHHPEVTDRLEAELTEVLGGRVPTAADLPRLRYTRMVIEESMRLYSPTWTIARDVRADDRIDGYRIPAGAMVMLSQYVVHRRPDLWPDPERFDPERFTPEVVKSRHKFAYFPFSTGPRVCIGNTFSLVESTLILATVCQRYRLQPVVGRQVPADVQITYRPRGGLPIERVRRREV